MNINIASRPFLAEDGERSIYSKLAIHDLKIGIVANEPSGDQLGAGLIRAIREQAPQASFQGVGGPLMNALGFKSLIPMEHLSVMGLAEVAKHILRLLKIRRDLTRYFLANPPHVFIGIDAPDFNLKLEHRLRLAKIPTVHYVSPTVWAWRPGRVHTIRRSTDLVLSIFPFEVTFLEKHQIPVRYVGHPLAEIIPPIPDQAAARCRLGLPLQQPVLALLPGSRISEVRLLTKLFLETARWCLERHQQIRLIMPLVNSQIRAHVESVCKTFEPRLPITLIDRDSHTVLAAADVVLTASGTATLEALLHQRPMVVAYRMHPITYWLVKTFNLVKVPHIAMSNLLADEAIAPEFIQDACRPEALGRALLQFFNAPDQVARIEKRYQEIYQQLHCNSGQLAAKAILELAARRDFLNY